MRCEWLSPPPCSCADKRMIRWGNPRKSQTGISRFALRRGRRPRGQPPSEPQSFWVQREWPGADGGRGGSEAPGPGRCGRQPSPLTIREASPGARPSPPAVPAGICPPLLLHIPTPQPQAPRPPHLCVHNCLSLSSWHNNQSPMWGPWEEIEHLGSEPSKAAFPYLQGLGPRDTAGIRLPARTGE